MAKKVKSLQQFKSLTENQLNALMQNEITTAGVLANMSVQWLCSVLNVRETKAEKILAEARSNLPEFQFASAESLVKAYTQKAYLATGSRSLDTLLGGKGLETGATVLLSGPYGSGKSQICFTAAIRTQLPVEKGGLDGSVIFFDIEQTLRPQRLKEISTNLGLDATEALENIRVIRPRSCAEQILAVKKLVDPDVSISAIVGPLKKEPKLLVIDSITAKFRAQYFGRGTLAQRQQKLNEHLADCHQFALKYNATVLFTNHVIANPDPYSAPYQPAGGHVLGHAATYNLLLKKLKYKRVAELIDSAHLPCGQAFYQVGRKGIIDAEEEQDEEEGPETSLSLD